MGWGRGVENNRRRPWVRTAPAAAARNPYSGPALALRPRPAPHRAHSIPSAAPGLPLRFPYAASRPAPARQPRGSPASRHSHHLRHRCPSRPPPPPPPALGPSAAAPRLLPRRRRRRRALCPPPEQRGRGIACGAHRRRRASCGRCLDSGTGPTPRGGREGGGELPEGPGLGPRLPSRASGKTGDSGSASGRALTADSARGPGVRESRQERWREGCDFPRLTRTCVETTFPSVPSGRQL